MSLPCSDCKDPGHCTGTYPDDDAHFPGRVRGCFAEKARSVKFQGPDVGMMRFVERQHDKDMAAYKRLRADGVQPRGIYASSAFEASADDKWAIEGKPPQELLDRYPLESAS